MENREREPKRDGNREREGGRERERSRLDVGRYFILFSEPKTNRVRNFSLNEENIEFPSFFP